MSHHVVWLIRIIQIHDSTTLQLLLSASCFAAVLQATVASYHVPFAADTYVSYRSAWSLVSIIVGLRHLSVSNIGFTNVGIKKC